MLQVFLIVLLMSRMQAESMRDSDKLIYDRIYSHENDTHFQNLRRPDVSSQIFPPANDLAHQVRRREVKLHGGLEELSIMLNENEMQIVERNMRIVDSLYKHFQYYLTHTNEMNRDTLEEYVETVIASRSGSVMDSLNEISFRIISYRGSFLKNVILTLLEEEWKITYTSVCDRGRSAQDILYDLYIKIIQTEMKAIYMFRYAYKALEISRNSTFTTELTRAETRYLEATQMYENVFKTLMPSAPRTLRRCDSTSGHHRGSTFHEFEKFLGVVIVPETALNQGHSCVGSCRLKPDMTNRLYPRYYKSFGRDYNDLESEPEPRFCYGSLITCVVLRSPMTICTEDENKSRRYSWLNDGKVYGDNSMGCPGELHTVSEWWKVWPPSWCELCACGCIEDNYRGRALKFVSLRKVTSNVTDNMVVTGLQFINTDSIIQIRIQVSRLTSHGKVDPDSTFWQQPEDLSFDRRASIKQKKYVFLQSSVKTLEPERDITILNFTNRIINLDELHVPEDSVVTGIRFSRISEEPENPIQLEIRATTFDYKTGWLRNTSNWIKADNMKSRLEAYKSERMRVNQSKKFKNPLDSMHTTPDFQPNKWIKLEVTGFKDDVAQTVIPLLDGLKVTGQPPVPLSGINLFHKSAKGYGGFLSFQIISLDRSRHMDIGDIVV